MFIVPAVTNLGSMLNVTALALVKNTKQNKLFCYGKTSDRAVCKTDLVNSVVDCCK